MAPLARRSKSGEGSLPTEDQADNACLIGAIAIGSLRMQKKGFSRCEFC